MIEIEITPKDLSRYGRFIRSQQSDKTLVADVKSVGQFPPKQRKSNYQSYYLKGKYVTGSRDTLNRMSVMKIPDNVAGLTVIDLGSQLGSMCFELYRRGAVKIVGVDSDIEYVKIARRIARANGMPINFIQMDLKDTGTLSSFCKQYYGGKIDVVLALSLYKHIGTKLFDAIGAIKWGECLVESNSCPDARRSEQAKEIEKGVGNISDVKYLGETTDRSTRCVWMLKDQKSG
jgi:SAM-dependent methyltransferase